uniref:SHSP domain-containing protein n=1 Tax=Fagus sylvatica TaxID=28930 RepID=A0A2N9GGV4_FAGSY
MASSIALRRVPVATLLSKLFNPIRSISVAPSLSRSFNTYTNSDDDDNSDSLRGTCFSSEKVYKNLRRGWDTKDEDDALCVLVEMPGLGKEDVKVYVEQNILCDSIKAETKNGVLKVVLPKLKAEESTDVFHVNIE